MTYERQLRQELLRKNDILLTVIEEHNALDYIDSSYHSDLLSLVDGNF